MAAAQLYDSNTGTQTQQPVVYSYYGGQDYLNANPGSTAEIQDPRTGQWYPYVPGDPNDNGRGNIRITPAAGGTSGGVSTTEPVAKTGGSYQQVGQAPDGVPIYTDGQGGYFTKSPDGTYASLGGPPPADWLTGGGGGPSAAPPPATGGGGGGGGLINPFPGGDFTPPGYTPPPAFAAPTWEEAANDPGFKFVQEQGQQGVERSAAARGVLNSGGTLQDIAKWNQGLAQTQYGNVYDRALGKYNTNYTTQYLDPYKNAYQGALQKYQTNYQAWLDRINTSAGLVNM
jgi:hypothetical protein